MNDRDTIIRMAREAGGLPDPMVFIGAYERFAAMIAAAEREVCAKVCRDIMDDFWTGEDRWETALHCSEMIMERGKK